MMDGITRGGRVAEGVREKMIAGAVRLLAQQGLQATSFSEVLAVTGAPRGSIYHHFPDGKAQLAEDAVRWTSERVLAYQRSCPAETPAGVLEWFIGMWRQVVIASGGASGCVVAGVAVDSMADDVALMAVVRSTFRSWVDLLTEQLHAVGLPAAQAEPVAVATLAGMEGALILCRAEGGVEPLDAVAEQLVRLVVPTPRSE
jgi:TetR/AcrR family transcriptional repressor of lmrAB and yxaGH operons